MKTVAFEDFMRVEDTRPQAMKYRLAFSNSCVRTSYAVPNGLISFLLLISGQSKGKARMERRRRLIGHESLKNLGRK